MSSWAGLPLWVILMSVARVALEALLMSLVCAAEEGHEEKMSMVHHVNTPHFLYPFIH